VNDSHHVRTTNVIRKKGFGVSSLVFFFNNTHKYSIIIIIIIIIIPSK
jgi:hypothetical protein